MSKLGLLGKLAMTRLPEPLVAAAYAGRRERLGPRVLDPKAQAAGRFANAVRVPGHIPTIEESRAQIRRIAGAFDEPCPPLARKQDLSIPGPAGTLAARLYSDRTSDAGALPILVYYHGGGWVQCNIDTHDGLCGKLAKASGAMVLSLAYRLAPEDPFPAAVEEALAAYLWARENAEGLGGDPARVGVGGDSAGGNLAAVVCQQCRASGQALPSLQVLIYTPFDARMASNSIRELGDAYIIPLERMEWYRELYLQDLSLAEDLRVSPLLADNFSGLPPAYVVTGGFDPLRDEGMAYSEKLAAAGVAATQRHFPGQIHAFASLTKVIPQGNQCLEEIGAWLEQTWTSEQ